MLAKLTTEDQAERILMELQGLLDLSLEESAPLPILNFGSVNMSAIINDWKEGVKQYHQYSQNELGEILEPSNTCVILFFQKKLDVHETCQPWMEEGEHWLSTSPDTQLLQVKWHQLVSMIHLLDCTLQGKPILLMDEVGVGKNYAGSRVNCPPDIFQGILYKKQSFSWVLE